MALASTNPVYAAAAYQQTGGTTKSAADELQERFMTLLVAQMRNQDPLNPMDNAQLTSQLAQLNTVTGIEKLNETVAMLMGRVRNNETLAGLTAVGRFALVEGEKISLYEGQSAAGFELPEDADSVTVRIYDSAGRMLYEAELGAHDAGLHTFMWDGTTSTGETAVNGNYRFEVIARTGEEKVAVTPLSIGRIDGVVPDQDELTFTIGGMPPTRLSEIKQFL